MVFPEPGGGVGVIAQSNAALLWALAPARTSRDCSFEIHNARAREVLEQRARGRELIAEVKIAAQPQARRIWACASAAQPSETG